MGMQMYLEPYCVPQIDLCRKTTVIVFKIFGIERAWQNQGSVEPRPRQLFITKSRSLANKTERNFVNLLISLDADPDTPQHVRERIQHWSERSTNGVLDPDLPEKFSDLQDSHFPLFTTVDTVGTTLGTKKRKLMSTGWSCSCGAS